MDEVSVTSSFDFCNFSLKFWFFGGLSVTKNATSGFTTVAVVAVAVVFSVNSSRGFKIFDVWGVATAVKLVVTSIAS